MMPSGVSDLTRPIDLRRRRLRRRRRIVVASIVVLIALLGAAVYVVGYTSAMSVRHIEVQLGEVPAAGGVLTTGQVRAVAKVPEGEGIPLARVDLSAVAGRVAALPPVAEVQVHRHWPDTLLITVTQRTPALQVRSGRDFLWADRSGVVFHSAASVDPALPQAVADPGNQSLLADLATTAEGFTPTLRRQTDHLTATGPDQIVVMLTGDRKIIWGSADQSEEKATVATAMLGTRGNVYDVSAPDHPTVR